MEGEASVRDQRLIDLGDFFVSGVTNLFYDIALLALGFSLVAKGGGLFVDSSIQIGRAFDIPRFVIGGTLVSIATTMPELVVSVTASMMGDSGIALGTAVGSCICNIGLIVGTVAMIMPVVVDRADFLKRASWMSLGGILVVLFSWDLTMSRAFGAILLVLTAAYLLWDFQGIRRLMAVRAAADDRVDGRESVSRSVGMFLIGAAFIIVGSRFLVTSGQNLASALGVPSAIIGFSVIAIGTSVPELVTGVAAARKGVPDLSLGNIVGANVLSLFLIVGLSGTIQPLILDPFSQWYAFPWMAVFFVSIIVLVLRNGRIARPAGGGLLALYLLYAVGLVALPALTG